MTQTNETGIQKGIDYKLLNQVRMDKNLTIAQLEQDTGIPQDTIKNILNGKTKNPGVENLNPICERLNVPIQNVLRQGEKIALENQGVKMDDASILALKEIYELQISTIKETSELHINNIRSHYEQHHHDLVDNFEKRLADKNEIIEIQKRENIASKIVAWVCGGILVVLLIAEVMNPNLGWLRY